MEGLMKDERGQMIILFAAAVIVVIISIAYLHAQNIIAGMESSRTMLAYPKEEIRNLKNLSEKCDADCNTQLQILCAKNGWLCDINKNDGLIVFKNVEVCYCEEMSPTASCEKRCT